MTKIAMCLRCTDIVAPRPDWDTNRAWRWCFGEHMGVRWRNGQTGELEVTAIDGRNGVRVIGLNNSFLAEATHAPPSSPEGWRSLHARRAEEARGYLFHRNQRDCWALMVAVGDSRDITFVPYENARDDFAHHL